MGGLDIMGGVDVMACLGLRFSIIFLEHSIFNFLFKNKKRVTPAF
jgi:hypothetical protein